MSGNLASTCHQPMTVFATCAFGSGKTHTNQGDGRGFKIKLELASSLLNRLQPTNGLYGLEK
jgi:hypothetical protein